MKTKLKKYIDKKAVIALNGPFGVGKTTLLKQYIEENPQDKFILFNAWEFDFAENPKSAFLLSVYKNIYQSLSSKKKLDELWKKGWTNIWTLINNGLKHKGFSNEGSSTKYEDYFQEYKSANSLILKIKQNIQSICEKYEGNVVLIIDDLDRARPDFSLEIFEIAKHIFDVDNLSIILVYNKETMNEIIKKRFGVIKGEEYLNKYIEYKVDFQEEPIYKTFLQHFSVSDGNIFSIFTQQLTSLFSISRRKVESVMAQNNCKNIVNLINEFGLGGISPIEAIFYSISIFFNWFLDDDPFERKIINGNINAIRIKNKYRESISYVFKNSLFDDNKNGYGWDKFPQIQELINTKDFIGNYFTTEDQKIQHALEESIV